MAKITAEQYLELLRNMTGEEHLEAAKATIGAMTEDQIVEWWKFSHSIVSPKKRWEYEVWRSEEDARVEESTTAFYITFPDGTHAMRSVTTKAGYNKNLCE